MDKVIIGKEEWCSLPELSLPLVKARVDSGAKTSTLHAFNITVSEEGGKNFVTFDIHPLQKNQHLVRQCKAEVIDRRSIRNSGGNSEKRYVIRTKLCLGEQSYDIELTLTNRDEMGYRMLLGREAMQDRFLVDPGASFNVKQVSKDEAAHSYSSKRIIEKKLKILILASDPELYSHHRLMEAGRLRGHDIRFVDVKYCYMNLNASKPVVCYRGNEVLENIDAVIPRLRPSMTFYGCAITRQLASQGAYVLNSAMSIAKARDKLRSLQILSSVGINLPITGFAHSPMDTKDLIKMVGGAPLVIKLLEGTQGRGVVLAETNKAAESVINAFKSLNANILVQEFIKEAQGVDIRCFVIDGKVVGAMQRAAQEGEFRANLHLGGIASAVRITREERAIAIKASKALGLKVAGVDIIRSANGPKVLEVNSSPGLEGIEEVTGLDIAGAMIETIEKHAHTRRKALIDSE